jgi:hypothetical protein
MKKLSKLESFLLGLRVKELIAVAATRSFAIVIPGSKSWFDIITNATIHFPSLSQDAWVLLTVFDTTFFIAVRIGLV